MVKNILIVDVDMYLDRAKNIIKKFEGEKSLVFYLNNEIINDSCNYIVVDNLIPKNYFFKLDKEIRKLMKNWYKPVENQLIYFDISLGQLINLEFIRIWPIFFKIDVILKLIKKENPRKIHLITEYEEDIKILNEIINPTKLEFTYTKFGVKSSKKINGLYKLIAKLQNLYFKLNLSHISKKNKILFIGNLRQSLPIFKELKKNKNNLIIRAGENPGRGFLSRYIDYYITFSEFSTPKLNKKLKKIKKEFIIKWNIIKNNKIFRNRLFYKKPLFKILEKDLGYTILNRFVSLIKYIEIMKILKFKVDIVVTQNDLVPFEKTLVQTANKLNIPTLTTIDGILSDNIIKRRETDFIPPSSQKMALFSDHQKQVIIKEFKDEVSEDRFVVTGFPIFDEYFNNEPLMDKEEICRLWKIDKNKNIILYITEQYNKNRKECSLLGLLTKKQHKKRYIELFKMVKEIPNLYLVIKPHPSGSLEDSFINNIASEMNIKDFIIVRNIDIYSLVNASTVIITRLSTVGLEAMILKKPVIIFDTYTDTSDYFEYTEFNAAFHAKRHGDLRKIIKNLFQDISVQEKIQHNMTKFLNKNYINDGKASKRIANLIENMVKSKT